MRTYLARILALGLAALPATAQAQYPAYYPQPAYRPAYPYGYPNGYPNGYANAAPQGYYYYPQPMPVYGNPYPYGYPVAPRAYPAGYLPATVPVQMTTSTPVIRNAAPTTSVALPVAPSSTPRTVQVAPASAAPVALPIAAAPTRAAPTAAAPAKQGPIEKIAAPVSAPVTGLLPVITGYSKAAISAPLPGDPAVVGEACPTACPTHHPLRVLLSADYLLWSVHGADVPYAQAFNGINPATAVPDGRVATVSPSYTSGFRLGAGVGLSDCSWIVAQVTYFHSLDTSTTAAPNGDVLRSLLAFPNTANAAGDSLTANAGYNITLVTADIAYKRAFINNDWLTMSWLAGGRYAHLDQHLTSTYAITGTTNLDSRVNFNGGGPRLGLAGQYRILGGFYGYGNGFANLIAGQFTGSASQHNLFAGLQGQSTVTENRVVPVLELELGFGWQTPNGRVRFSGGYYVGSWFNTMTVPNLQQAITGTNYTTNGNNLRDNLIFDGLVGRVQLSF